MTPERLQQHADEFQKKYGYFLTTKQAAEFLGLSPNTLLKWRRKEHDPVYTILGRSVRYPLDSLVEFTRGGMVE